MEGEKPPVAGVVMTTGVAVAHVTAEAAATRARKTGDGGARETGGESSRRLRGPGIRIATRRQARRWKNTRQRVYLDGRVQATRRRGHAGGGGEAGGGLVTGRKENHFYGRPLVAHLF